MRKKAFNKIAAGLNEAIAIGRGEQEPARLHVPFKPDGKKAKARKTMIRVPTHPGKILKEEFMSPLGMTTGELAKALNIPPDHLAEIIDCKRPVTTEIAHRLARLFNTTPDLWVNLQTNNDQARVL